MLRPIQDKVILKIIEEEEKTKNGIIIIENEKDKAQFAKIIAVGPGKIDNGIRTIMEVREGDSVFIERGCGNKILYEGEEYLVVKQSEILSIIK